MAILNRKITDKEYQKLADETGVSQYDLQKLNSMGLLRDNVMRDLLISHDYKKVKRTQIYNPSQIITRLAMFYHVGRQTVINAVCRKTATRYFCEECGKLIPKPQYIRNNGLCDDCVAKSIEI